MKKIILWLLLIMLVLAGCVANNNPATSESSQSESEENNDFFGIILGNHETSILVEPEAGSWARSSSDKISVSVLNAELIDNISGKTITAEDLSVGLKVKISFSGGILESYPAQINSCYEARLMTSKYTLDDFWSLFREVIESSQPPGFSYVESKDNFFDITPESVFVETGCQIFKENYGYKTYLIYINEIYPLGDAFGDLGILDIKTCDFDNNGVKDIIFTYAWGSGLHHACIGMFDMSTMSESDIYSTSFDHDIYCFVLDKKADDAFDAYSANLLIGQANDLLIDFEKDKLIGEIIAENGAPEWQLTE